MRQHAQEEEDTEINMSPMLDIVFIMLIFFIVTATFIKEAGTNVVKPTAETSLIQDRASILVAVTPEDEIWINNQKVDEKAVRSVIEKLHSENPKGTVVIQADRQANAKTFLAVRDAVFAAGVPEVALATER